MVDYTTDFVINNIYILDYESIILMNQNIKITYDTKLIDYNYGKTHGTHTPAM